jgi:adenylate cyclase
MPKGPVVAVLPFTNMSGDPGQDYFSDGLSEDIITELARFREVHVLARNTTFQYKGQSVDVPAVGRKLGAQYVLEGSVRRAENQLRISVQLIDVASGGHIWAERFDRKPEDVFAVQDEVTRQIVGAIAGGAGGLIHDSVMRKARTKKLEQMEAYELVLQARIGPYSQDWYDKGKAALERAIALDPTYARARDEYAWLRMMGWIFRFDPSPSPPDEILENAVRAVQLDPHDAHAHRTAAYGYYFRKQFDAFERAAMTALHLAPYNASIYAELGMLFTFQGQWERGIALIDKAHALNPESASGWSHTAWHYDFYRKEEYQRALDILFGHPTMAVCETQWKFVAAYGQLGQPEKAKKHWDRCMALVPGLSTDFIANVLRLWNFQEPFIQHYMEGFRKAGHPCQFQDCRRPQHSMSGKPSVPSR